MNIFHPVVVIVAGLVGLAAEGRGQGMFESAGPPDASSRLAILLCDRTFTADANTVIKDASGETITMKTSQAVSGKYLRNETNMSDMKAAGLTADAVTQMKQMGFDRNVTIHNAADGTTMLIYPGLKSYVVLEPSGTTSDTDEKPKIERTKLSEESIDGHPSVKYKTTVTTAEGQTQEFLVWEASDLGEFPIKTEFAAEGSTITTTYSNINQKKPDDALFKVPSGYKKYNDMQQMMMGAMSERMPEMMGQ